MYCSTTRGACQGQQSRAEKAAQRGAAAAQIDPPQRQHQNDSLQASESAQECRCTCQKPVVLSSRHDRQQGQQQPDRRLEDRGEDDQQVQLRQCRPDLDEALEDEEQLAAQAEARAVLGPLPDEEAIPAFDDVFEPKESDETPATAEPESLLSDAETEEPGTGEENEDVRD